MARQPVALTAGGPTPRSPKRGDPFSGAGPASHKRGKDWHRLNTAYESLVTVPRGFGLPGTSPRPRQKKPIGVPMG